MVECSPTNPEVRGSSPLGDEGFYLFLKDLKCYGFDGEEHLTDAIGVLGGGWFSLPLLAGQRRPATVRLFNKAGLKEACLLFYKEAYKDFFVFSVIPCVWPLHFRLMSYSK